MGISNPLSASLDSFLVGRTSQVRLPGSLSSPFRITSGVPQGSVLSPLLFSLFVNDCSLVLPPDGLLLYADDIKVFHPISSPDDTRSLQRAIDAFTARCM
ncbi:reverse transcriptase domain-containing protein, partial [Acinetobacter baumannii]|uniref:reverse transcriptase domain-containing protein n=1 Tax=Acinetobacter baumannii TaxID=470 RepID=UPI003D323FFE